MISIDFRNSDVLLEANLRENGPKIIRALIVKLDRLMLLLQQKIVQKLSGEVLHHGSGNLIRSIVIEKAHVEGDRLLTAGVTGASGTAWYGRVHEFGGTRAYDIFPKNKKALAFFGPYSRIGSSYANYGQLTAKGAKSIIRGMRSEKESTRTKAIRDFGNVGGIVVKHVHHPPLPKRPFMSTSLDEMKDYIITELNATVAENLFKKK